MTSVQVLVCLTEGNDFARQARVCANFSDPGGVCRAVAVTACPEHVWVTFTWAARNVRSLIPEQDQGRTEALKFRTALPKSPAQLMPNPGGNEVLFLGCQHLKIQDILPFTYPQPPQVGPLRGCLSPGPSAGIRSSDTFPCKTRPTAPAA